ncbi:3-hexulose-6-phosphate synthase [Halobacillus sp. Marseille-Q1614]|uniref:3-hexulose-6-phosphate synthase n=1 Tax=Halobacillus sp. Marseille-Q1614 TaxID=2709134 RepID=UPI001570A123|nr:3-hexulose-6-phosphate synthase [Halobacillus sp. Marseille-Q1614]
MKLQLALDRLPEEKCMEVIEETSASADWIEIGTGVIKEYGMDIVRKVRDRYKDAVIVADMKTCDAGQHEAEQVFKAGADITTVMAFAADQTIKDMLETARNYDGRIMVDLLGIQNKERIKRIHALGAGLVSLHFGKDMQKNGEFDQSLFELVEDFPHLEVALAGGINLQSLPDVVKHKPDILIVGGAITKQKDCKKAAQQIKEAIRSYETDDTYSR